ncbi:DUF2332 domain-containing protein [Saccharococcus caldoxylosilyticus]|jgi:hypothetical protein|uniref:DUF2332 domain-containing protein n=1 Tax=Saccharococcus caldoxylosilyticus TaxID=81408 RepID=UPI000311950D|nr:DUF2332 domain-containing protein [Parageobacillus caldoxylosilyticus]
MSLEVISERFRRFAIRECRDSSELYEQLALNIAEDDELLRLASAARSGQPIPNLLFGAVHYLLLKGYRHELREFYGSIVDQPRNPQHAFPYFRDFCIHYQEDITAMLTSKLVQTNEVRRCAYLYPSFCFIYNIAKKPLSLIEIGTSAGLQLAWDKYRYDYGLHETYGNPHSNVVITSEIRGERLPFLLPKSPPVAERVGVDLHVNDLQNEEDRLWMQALIWPEHKERRELFQKAARCLEKTPVRFVEGDGIALLPNIAAAIPEDTAICVFHTHVANQIPDDAKHMLLERIKGIGQTRDIFHLYNNMWDVKLHLDYFVDGEEYNKIIGETDGHARWFRWELDCG